MAVSSKKSTKKPARKPAAKTKKTTAKKQEVVKAVSSTKGSKKAPLTPLERLSSLNLMTGVLFLILAAVVSYFVSPITTNLTQSLQVRDQFAGSDANILGPGTEVLATVEIRYLLAAILVIGGVASILLAKRFRSQYEATLASKASTLRWLITGITGGLTLEFVSVLAGITDLAVLKVIAGLVVVAALLGIISDRDNTGAKPKWLAFTAGVFASVLAWVPVVSTFIATWVYGSERFEWYVYAVAGVVAAGFLSVGVNQYRLIKRGGDYIKAEEKHLKTELFTKLALVIVILSAIYK